jgi:hypothetical protein
MRCIRSLFRSYDGGLSIVTLVFIRLAAKNIKTGSRNKYHRD